MAHQLEFFKPNGEEDISRGYFWLDERYGVEKKVITRENMNLRRIDDEEDEEEEGYKRYETPKVKIALFTSGKSTHEYFFSRGFTQETVKKFMIGWDSELLRVTMPIFWRDGMMFGLIGRAILNPKLDNGEPNPDYTKLYSGKNYARYFIYDSAPIGEVMYPLNHFELIDDTAVLVEGQMDAIWQHQLKHPNVLSCINSKLSFDKKTKQSFQKDILLELGVKKVVLMMDDDEAGRDGCKHNYELLKDDFVVYGVTYPKGKTDPQMLTKAEYEYMLAHKYLYGKNGKVKKLRRLR